MKLVLGEHLKSIENCPFSNNIAAVIATVAQIPQCVRIMLLSARLCCTRMNFHTIKIHIVCALVTTIKFIWTTWALSRQWNESKERMKEWSINKQTNKRNTNFLNAKCTKKTGSTDKIHKFLWLCKQKSKSGERDFLRTVEIAGLLGKLWLR